MEFNESVTKENLARAFAGLCQDGARYQFIAKTATSEGYHYISDVLKDIAKNKMAHASILYELMLNNIDKSVENVNIEAGYPFENQLLNTSLLTSSEIEKNEGQNIFPHFAKIARDEGFIEIEETLNLISEVNLANSKRLEFLANKFDSDNLYYSEKPSLWICSNCGHRENKRHAWDNCPLCSYPQGYIIIPEESDE